MHTLSPAASAIAAALETRDSAGLVQAKNNEIGGAATANIVNIGWGEHHLIGTKGQGYPLAQMTERRRVLTVSRLLQHLDAIGLARTRHALRGQYIPRLVRIATQARIADRRP